MAGTAGTENKVWLDYTQKELDDQYNQRILVPDADDYMARHGALSEKVRGEIACTLDVPYGPSEAERLDIFPAPQPGAPVVVYYHGGAWTRWDKANNSYQAPVFTAAGATFVPVNFGLVPAVTLDELVRQCRAAVKWVWENARSFGADPDRLYVAGHSSGGHVVGLLAVTDWEGDWGLPADVIKGAFAASGMYELEPVRLSSRNKYLSLDEGMTARNSALRQLPERMPPMIIAYGGGEQLEFRRHSKDFAAELRRFGHRVTELDLPGLHHFQMAEQFADPDGPLLRAMFREMGLQE
ncbi:MAG: alpha/beta hydrolase [Rhodospirillaceae bacterium]